MISVREIAAEIVAREGGYVNDPDDLGGPTKFGVTIGTMQRLGIDLDGDGDVDVDDVKLLSRGQAEAIFKKHYFERPKINLLPVDVQASVFDMYVNAGGNAIKILQRLVAQFDVPVAVDGALGPMTAKAVAEASKRAGGRFPDAYGIARRNYYYALGDKRPANRKYSRRRDGGKGGWIIRAEEFISGKYHLTDAEHRARVSKWAS